MLIEGLQGDREVRQAGSADGRRLAGNLRCSAAEVNRVPQVRDHSEPLEPGQQGKAKAHQARAPVRGVVCGCPHRLAAGFDGLAQIAGLPGLREPQP